MAARLMVFAKTAVKNLFSKPATINYPAEPREYFERTRGHIEIDIEQCIFCGMCMRNCPPRAITVDRASGKWSLNRFDCIQCGYCTDVCPKKCLSIVPGYTEPYTEKSIYTAERPGGPPVPPKPARKPVDRKSAAKAKAINKAGEEYKEKIKEKKNAKKKKYLPKHYLSLAGSPVPHNDFSKCIFCSLCARNCPSGALTVDRKNRIWEVDEGLCTACGVCENGCPKKCLDVRPGSNYYDEKLRRIKSEHETPDPWDANKEVIGAVSAEKVTASEGSTASEDRENGKTSAAGSSDQGKAASKENSVRKADSESDAASGKKIPHCNTDECVFCGACAGGCPVGAITVDSDASVWKVDGDVCVSCGACVSNCPQGCLEMKE